MPTKRNLSTPKGDSVIYEITLTDVNGVAYNITGWTVEFLMKKKKTDTSYVINKSVTSHYSAAEGKSRISITASDTDALTPGIYHYDIRVITEALEEYTMYTGTYTIDKT